MQLLAEIFLSIALVIADVNAKPNYTRGTASVQKHDMQRGGGAAAIVDAFVSSKNTASSHLQDSTSGSKQREMDSSLALPRSSRKSDRRRMRRRAQLTPESTGLYYPDYHWSSTNSCKLDDGDAPTYMKSDPSAWMEDRLEDCCIRYYTWNYYDCVLSGTVSAQVKSYSNSNPPPRHDRKVPRRKANPRRKPKNQ